VTKRKQKTKNQHQAISKKSPSLSSGSASKTLSKKKSKRQFVSIIRSVMVLVVLVMVGGAGITALNNNYDTNHDLSVIGQGIPTVVMGVPTESQKGIKISTNNAL
jgi:hypothetical protein